MNLGKQNHQYWRTYEAGTTPGVGEIPALDLLEALPNKARVLDVGTGTGKLAQDLAQLGIETYGIDINPNEIKANVEKDTSAQFSVQDITKTTTFPDNFFDLLLFRYTLTNIHQDQWQGLTAEVNRITKPGSYIWLAEPHITDAYAERYTLGSESLGDEHVLYVFKNKDLAAKVKDIASLKAAIKQDKIARIVRHYDELELKGLFPLFRQISIKHVNDLSPSGYPLDTVIMTLQKG